MTVVKLTDREIEVLLHALEETMERTALGAPIYKEMSALADRLENGATADVN
jgi:hypothetical protein